MHIYSFTYIFIIYEQEAVVRFVKNLYELHWFVLLVVLFISNMNYYPKLVIRISICRMTLRNPNDRFCFMLQRDYVFWT